jgi:frataxin
VPAIVRLNQNVKISVARNFSSVFSKSPEYSEAPVVDIATFEPLCAATLESLTDYFEEIVEADERLVNADVSYSVRELFSANLYVNLNSSLFTQDGVLNVKLGNGIGTYVINRQTPNRQIWLSSPKSGPKRYDLINGNWIYKHDGVSLHQLLQDELEKIMSNPVDFIQLTRK